MIAAYLCLKRQAKSMAEKIQPICVSLQLEALTVFTQTFFLILPRIWQSLLTPSMHIASNRPLPSIRKTWAYSAWRGLAIEPPGFHLGYRLLHAFINALYQIFAVLTSKITVEWSYVVRPPWKLARAFPRLHSSLQDKESQANLCIDLEVCEMKRLSNLTCSWEGYLPLLRFFPPFPADQAGLACCAQKSRRRSFARAPCWRTYLCSWASALLGSRLLCYYHFDKRKIKPESVVQQLIFCDPRGASATARAQKKEVQASGPWWAIVFSK